MVVKFITTNEYLWDKYIVNMGDDDTLAIDATYNTNVENFCVWLFGMLLKNSSFQPVGEMVSSHETTDDVKYLLKAIKDTSKKDPKYVMADGAQTISRAVLEVFPDSIRLMCWFHVAQNLKKQGAALKKNKDEPDLWSELWFDISILQKLSLNDESKKKLFGLLKVKWFEYTEDKNLKNKIQNFFISLATWMEGHARRWCEYENPGGSSTNNGLEGTNSAIKHYYTGREKKGLKDIVKLTGELWTKLLLKKVKKRGCLMETQLVRS